MMSRTAGCSRYSSSLSVVSTELVPGDETSTTSVGLSATIASGSGGPQSTTTSGYRMVLSSVWTAVSPEVVRQPPDFDCGPTEETMFETTTLRPCLAPAII